MVSRFLCAAAQSHGLQSQGYVSRHCCRRSLVIASGESREVFRRYFFTSFNKSTVVRTEESTARYCSALRRRFYVLDMGCLTLKGNVSVCMPFIHPPNVARVQPNSDTSLITEQRESEIPTDDAESVDEGTSQTSEKGCFSHCFGCEGCTRRLSLFPRLIESRGDDTEKLPANASQWESLVPEDGWTSIGAEAVEESSVWEACRYYPAGDLADGVNQAILDAESGEL